MDIQMHDSKTVYIRHHTILSNNSFEIVKAKLERIVPRIDDGIFTLLRYGESERALKELEALPALSIFGYRDHGAVLSIVGLNRKALQYDIGNPLTASKMTRHRISAALYAPIRVLLREDEDGIVGFEYDLPVSTFGQFSNRDVDAVARQLDADLQATVEDAAT